MFETPSKPMIVAVPALAEGHSLIEMLANAYRQSMDNDGERISSLPESERRQLCESMAEELKWLAALRRQCNIMHFTALRVTAILGIDEATLPGPPAASLDGSLEMLAARMLEMASMFDRVITGDYLARLAAMSDAGRAAAIGAEAKGTAQVRAVREAAGLLAGATSRMLHLIDRDATENH